jgi:ABC-type polysaccharide/polyol phosphate export permease
VTATTPVLELDARPASLRAALGDVWRHRSVLKALARTDFQARYKRATLGLLWAVAVPLIQAAVLAVVFSRAIRIGTGPDFGAYVLSGVVAWSYFAMTIGTASVAVVEGSGLTDKIWFPRALLPMAPAVANLVGLLVSALTLVATLPLFGVDLGPQLLWLLPAAALLVAFTTALALVAAALHVYFRDVRFIVQAALLVWFYVTPIFYPLDAIGGLRHVIEANPMTGIVTMFRLATVGVDGAWLGPVIISMAVTVLLLLAAVEAYRRHDRLFADQL